MTTHKQIVLAGHLGHYAPHTQEAISAYRRGSGGSGHTGSTESAEVYDPTQLLQGDKLRQSLGESEASTYSQDQVDGHEVTSVSLADRKDVSYQSNIQEHPHSHSARWINSKLGQEWLRQREGLVG